MHEADSLVYKVSDRPVPEPTTDRPPPGTTTGTGAGTGPGPGTGPMLCRVCARGYRKARATRT